MGQSVFEKHPKRTMTIVLLVLLAFIGVIAEITLRFVVPYNIGYYTAVRGEGVYEYPYGTIHINSEGYPDEEFDRNSDRKKIGYFGDSVTFGVGAGEGYRFSDLLQKGYPGFEHWTFSMIANGIQNEEILKKAEEYKLNTVVYLFNLNDLLPVAGSQSAAQVTSGETYLQGAIAFAARNMDWLRGKSYLYNTLRTSFKNLMMRMGYGHNGFIAIEQFPSQHLGVFDDVSKKVNDTAAELKKRGIDFCLVILPYEMQISKDAAKTYSDLGIKWEDGFGNGSTQAMLLERLRFKNIYDGREAFDDVRATAPVGTYFVYNKGDKIDYNHPNRAGHAMLAKGFEKSKTCAFLR